MQQAVTKYATRAGEKLRQENRLAKVVTVFIRSSAYDAGGVPYSNQATEVLPVPSGIPATSSPRRSWDCRVSGVRACGMQKPA